MHDLFMVLWYGGYDKPEINFFKHDWEAHAHLARIEDSFDPEQDSIEIHRINGDDLSVELIWQL